MHLPAVTRAPAYQASPPAEEKKRAPFLFPAFKVPGTLRAPAFCSFRAAGHLDTLAVDERIGNFPAGFVQVAPRGLARDPKSFRRLFLFKSFEVDEPYQFDLIRLQRDPLSLFLRAAAGLVTAGF
jgi:hypothetical protein